MKKLFIFITFITLAIPSFAERLMPIEFVGQPVLHLTDGRPSACGIRFLGVQSPADENNPNETIWVPDGSFMIYRKGYGLVKAVAIQSDVKSLLEHKVPVGQSFKSFWFKVEGQKATVPLTPITKGDNENSKLYVTDLTSVVEIYSSIIEGKILQFALKFDNGNDIAFYGKVRLKPDEKQQILSCMNELSNLIQEDVKVESK